MPLSELFIVSAEGTWVVRAGGAVIGESDRALELVEDDGPAVIYFPRDDLGMAFLEGSGRTAASRALGDARFYSIVTGAGVIEDAAWSYETPRRRRAHRRSHRLRQPPGGGRGRLAAAPVRPKRAPPVLTPAPRQVACRHGSAAGSLGRLLQSGRGRQRTRFASAALHGPRGTRRRGRGLILLTVQPALPFASALALRRTPGRSGLAFAGRNARAEPASRQQ